MSISIYIHIHQYYISQKILHWGRMNEWMMNGEWFNWFNDELPIYILQWLQSSLPIPIPSLPASEVQVQQVQRSAAPGPAGARWVAPAPPRGRGARAGATPSAPGTRDSGWWRLARKKVRQKVGKAWKSWFELDKCIEMVIWYGFYWWILGMFFTEFHGGWMDFNGGFMVA